MKKRFASRNSIILIVLIVPVFWITGLIAAARNNSEPNEPNEPGETCWESSTPEQQGMDSKLLLDMLQKIEKEEIGVRSILVIRNHRLVLESYLHPYTREIPHNTKSASKSIVSALVGIALREKWIDSLDRTVYSFFPEYFPDAADTRKKEINLRHLLIMSSGLKIKEQTQDTERIFDGANPVKETFAFPMAENPGERFNYLTPLTLVMVEILKAASGKSLQEIVDSYLFNPLGIEGVLWKEVPPGYFFTDALMRPLDMAKFGVLFLEKGKWQGKQVIPAQWVEESTQNHLAHQPDAEGPYGYWWWRSRSRDMFMALGWGGQGIYVWPEENMVIVTTAADYEKAQSMVFDYILPSVKSKGPIPPNPRGVKALQNVIRRLQSGTSAVLPVTPGPAATLKEINGKTYLLEPNIAGLVRLKFQFGDNSCRLTLESVKGTSEAEVGLDNVYRVSDSGRYGDMPEHNRLALKGKWKNTNTFFLDFHWLGRPEQGLLDIEFKGEELTISGWVLGTDIKFTIQGKRKTE